MLVDQAFKAASWLSHFLNGATLTLDSTDILMGKAALLPRTIHSVTLPSMTRADQILDDSERNPRNSNF